MKWVTFTRPEAPSTERIGIVDGGTIHGLPPGPSLLDLLGDDGERLAEAGEQARRDPDLSVAIGDVRLLAPIPRPPALRDSYAFEQHMTTARRRRGLDIDPAWYELPIFYFGSPYTVTGPQAPVFPPAGCRELDYELEVAAVVGRGGRNLTSEVAESHIAGYMVMNDWSARDLQRTEMRLSLGPHKGKDFATTFGPWLVTPDELADTKTSTGHDLAMRAWVNGRLYSEDRWSNVHYSFAEMLAYASRDSAIGVGDIHGSGTCATGCILELSLVHGSDAYPWLQAGDVVELEIERLGRLTNPVGVRRDVTA